MTHKMGPKARTLDISDEELIEEYGPIVGPAIARLGDSAATATSEEKEAAARFAEQNEREAREFERRLRERS